MPVEPSGNDQWLISGRVIAQRGDGDLIVDCGDGRAWVEGAGSETDFVPGDLVRATCETIGETDAGERRFRALNTELVFRPKRTPWSAGTETVAFGSDGLRDRLALRCKVMEAIRAHFQREGFLEVETPSIATSPGLDVHLHAYHVTESPTPQRERGPDESGRRTSVPPSGPRAIGYLITSPEYHMKRLLVGGVLRCFQFARCFRSGEVGVRHEPEFTMLEWYRAWSRLDVMLDDTMSVLRTAASVTATPSELKVRGESVSLRDGFDRITVRDAFARHASDIPDPIALAESDEERYFTALVDRIEPQLGRGRPTFLTHFPARHASLSRLAPEDPTVCERFELYVRGVELSNGFVELTDPIEQHARFERDQRDRTQRGLPVYPMDERFIAALEEGMPPSVGNALGFDRLLALLVGGKPIADVIAFPSRRR